MTSQWQQVARQDWSQAVEQRSVKVLLALPVVVILLSAYLYPVISQSPITTGRFGSFVRGLLRVVIPIVGVLLGYNAIVGDFESGSLLLMLSLPQRRRTIVFARYIARAGLLIIPTVIAVVAGAGLVVYPLGSFEPLSVLMLTSIIAGFSATWVSVGVAASTLVATTRRALGLGFATVILFAIVWDTIENVLRGVLLSTDIISGRLPEPIQFVFALSPGNAFSTLITGFVDTTQEVTGAWYLSEWIAAIVLLAWVVGPLAIGVFRFERRDLQ